MGLTRDFYEGSWLFGQVGIIRNGVALYLSCQL